MDAMVEPLRASSEVDAAPDWSVVPFAVVCARCGHDLHGRSEPTCPGCALTFRWADAVPIEQLTCASCGYHLYGLKEPRCPECATEFKWDEALANYHRQRKPLFEYQWRTKPVRSLLFTWWQAMRPKKLWTAVEIHDPISIWPLVGFALFTLLIVMILVASISNLMWLSALIMNSLRSPNYWQSRGFTPSEVMLIYLDWVFSGWKRSMSVVMAGYLCLWFSGLGLSLVIFIPSMLRQKIQPRHLLRIVTYACALGWAGIALGTLTNFGIYMIFGYDRITQFVGGAIVVLAWIYSVRSVAIAYRDYLHLDHPWAIAFSAHVVAVLFTFLMAVPLLPEGAGAELLHAIGKSIGIL